MGPRPNGTRIRDGDMGEKERNNHDPEKDGDQLDQAATDEDDQVASVTTHPALASPGPFWERAPHRFATAPGSELVLGPVRSSPTACRNVERGINLRSDCPSGIDRRTSSASESHQRLRAGRQSPKYEHPSREPPVL